MDLQTFMTILKERWVAALLTAVLVLGAVVGYTLLQTPTYQATNRVFVQTQTGSSITELTSGQSFATSQITTYADLATSPLVLEPVIERLQLETTPEQLAEDISTQVPVQTLVLEITASSQDAPRAAAIANATSRSLQEQVTALEETVNASAVELTVIAPAEVPTSPSSPNFLLNIMAGVVLALLAGIGVAILRALVDNRVRKAEDVQKTFDLPVLATLPDSRDSKRYPLVVAENPQSPESEAYRKLRTNLQFIGVEEGHKAVLVTSSIPGEGKTSTAINLAHVLAQSGDRVLLIDADLRRPSVHDYLHLESGAGLTTVLIGQASLADVTQPLSVAGLDVLTSGAIPPNPSEMLGSPSMQRLLDEARQTYDFVVVDTSPLLAVTDAAVLSRTVGATVVVAQSEKVKKPQLEQSLRQLEVVDARVFGIVLNRAGTLSGMAYNYTYSASTSGKSPSGNDGGSDSGSGASVPADAETRLARSRSATRRPTHRGDVPVGPMAARMPLDDQATA